MNLEQAYSRILRKEKREREAVMLADWLIDHDSTVLELEKECMIPKSTAHRRLTITLKDVDYDKWLQCKNILKRHRRVYKKHKH